MSAPIRVRKNLLGLYEPRTVQKEIRDLMQDDYYKTITLRPVYQRHIRWSKDAMNDFIGTVMNNGLVPGIIMYRLYPEDKVGNNKSKEYEGKEYEVVDGQHRLFTLKAFFDSTYQNCPHIAKKFIVYWNYEPNMPVFFKDTPDVHEWCKNNGKTPYFLTEEETVYFLRFSLNITTIASHVPLDQRREIFMSLQKGIPVRNSDLLKNKIDCKLIAFMSEESYEQIMLDDFIKHCTKNAPKYWVNWVARCFLLYHAYIKKRDTGNYQADIAYATTDKVIEKWIKSNSKFLNPTDDILYGFDDAFRTFILFLKQDRLEKVVFNPTQLFALFYWSCTAPESIDEAVLSHMHFFAKEGHAKIKRNMWESNTEPEPRKEYFNECVSQILAMTEVAQPLDEAPIHSSTRMAVWEKCVDGKCEICDYKISEATFEAGHIIARALGGQQNLENLIPICFDCNRSMGTRNPYEYKKEVYPNLFSL